MLSRKHDIRSVSLVCAVVCTPIAGHAASVTFEFAAELDNASFDLIAAAGGLAGFDLFGARHRA